MAQETGRQILVRYTRTFLSGALYASGALCAYCFIHNFFVEQIFFLELLLVSSGALIAMWIVIPNAYGSLGLPMAMLNGMWISLIVSFVIYPLRVTDFFSAPLLVQGLAAVAIVSCFMTPVIAVVSLINKDKILRRDKICEKCASGENTTKS